MTSSLFVILWFVAGSKNLIYNNKGQQFLEEANLIPWYPSLQHKITAVTTDFYHYAFVFYYPLLLQCTHQHLPPSEPSSRVLAQDSSFESA